ncbi:CUE domain-containing protein 2 [Callorhinchus milii]|uniref:CUE domain containing 2 n=1 Tax=Callorhinchus milii TaxID=7868 RepID=A0A4W3HW62_CALMI|nr:CUE domain-containing protein 2 [Callorhinchus milii]XP_042192931.1 CUE domain-containing protein 2 [Callorhinchus milii]|eukprot:gi/632937204/ref/XP_007897643.1/ PREDICTED: CUE domain-containing protein 2 [Callorhinchus milii]
MALDKLIHKSLTEFVHLYVPGADLSVVDEVVLSYITGVLEELGSPYCSEENFDVEMFVEMMEAYVPGFAEISSVTVCEMMFDLAAQLNEARNKENVPPQGSSGDDRSPTEELVSEREENETAEQAKEAGAQTAGAEGATAKEDSAQVQDGVQLLVEMFPSCRASEAHHVLSMAKGNMEYAVQLLMEGAMNLSETSATKEVPLKTSLPAPDKKLKASILEKYMMVDNEEDLKVHKPLAPKEAPKKLVRYIDNQVVSTKGERFTQAKKSESEEMKKTYINLKPARKYKFH